MTAEEPIATALIYPIPFLYAPDFTSGASGLPHHVWTNAQPVKTGLIATEPNVFMRSIWVHGSYMKALERNVLLGALELQDEILGPTKGFNPRVLSNNVTVRDPLANLSVLERDTLHVVNGLTNQSWFFHSPLLYWSNDHELIAIDPNILATVNEHKNQHTSLNVTLRHSVVFSGKRFEDRALVAADAIVITLIHLRDSPVGRQWERKVAELATHVTDKWDVYPQDARNLSSQLYEFQFLPISIQDSVMLTLAYCLTFVYVIHNLSKIPAIKSRPGLMVTFVTQIFVSILSSFTVCAILQIDLSRIPRAAYPIVIISMSLENMLRLINAVIATNPEESTSSRIGTAFGETTHIALASVVEHLVLLWGISKLVTTGLSDFCAFLAIAIVFDFFYFSTFFLSVLSVEVRRSELSDFLEKSSSTKRNQRPPGPSMYPDDFVSPQKSISRKTWITAVLQGRIDASTRIAGTIILLGFVIIAQWHFFENESISHTLNRMFTYGIGYGGSRNNLTDWSSASSQLRDLHQARSLTSWLRLQDHETAREVIRVVKPEAHSYIARVYEPLVLVLKGSDRMQSVTERPFLPAVYDFFRHQSTPFLVVILVLTAAMRIFLNYLLWDEMADNSGDVDAPNEPTLSVKTLDQGHALDVALLAASSDGLVVSVGLDRWIRVWNLPRGGVNYPLRKRDALSDDPFPVLLAIDNDSTWLAILSHNNVMLWNLETKEWGLSVAIDLSGQKPEAFFFMPRQRTDLARSLVVVRRNGTLTELWVDTGETLDSPICKTTLLSAVSFQPLHSPATGPSGSGCVAIIAVSQNGCVHRATPTYRGWISEEIKQQTDNEEHAHSVVALPLFSACLVVRPHSVDMVDLATSETLHTFVSHLQIKPRSLRCIFSTRRHSKRSSPRLSYFSLIYTCAESGNCVIQTYLPQDDDGSILFSQDDLSDTSSTDGAPSCMWHETRQTIEEVPNPGLWEALPNGCVIGVRQTSILGQRGGNRSGATGSEAVINRSNILRRRGVNTSTYTRSATSSPRPSQRKPDYSSGRDSWEAWSICSVVDSAKSIIDTAPERSHNGDASAVTRTAATATATSTTNASRDKNYMTHPMAVDEGELLVTELGPIACVGAGTIALGLGAAIKIITIGHERFGSPAEMLEAAAGQMMETSSVANRRRKNRSIQRATVT
ncbi:sterol regulatory element-binding protein cleavage-activating protein [Sporothrix brasiliensis 5110]|uniref:Sterol regulatory element-binding protein cleavage-activating protein n=1 Tax=Sporothrix brasiliensis 5110 TaxID=1398154 RepID=A0A0C2FID7_9PEZI|nr:sterol regulatory element-binding protein cleavage-activating protein [Sporothrix brasiliensis 5110]KIH90823.1 sterol regulatory element-binding protein cleavage-activating protein [Sporothrix brasiliensis 5110]